MWSCANYLHYIFKAIIISRLLSSRSFTNEDLHWKPLQTKQPKPFSFHSVANVHKTFSVQCAYSRRVPITPYANLCSLNWFPSLLAVSWYPALLLLVHKTNQINYRAKKWSHCGSVLIGELQSYSSKPELKFYRPVYQNGSWKVWSQFIYLAGFISLIARINWSFVPLVGSLTIHTICQCSLDQIDRSARLCGWHLIRHFLASTFVSSFSLYICLFPLSTVNLKRLLRYFWFVNLI